jgi:hypothetical protein
MHYLNHKKLIVLITVFFLITVLAYPAQAQYCRSEVSGAGMVADLVVLRPLGLAATAIGSVFFVASLPFTIWSGKGLKRAGTYLVVEPAAYTFVRPLGEWDVQ